MKAPFSFTAIAALILIGASPATAQPQSAAAPAPAAADTRSKMAQATSSPQPPTAAAAGRGARPPAPQRDPLAAGYVKATELPDGGVPPMETDGNFIIGPNHSPASEMSPVAAGQPKGTVHKFTLDSADSKFYPGVERDEPAAGAAPAGPNAAVGNHPKPYKRTVSVYVPAQYVPGTVAPVLITTDGDGRAYNVLDHLIPEKKLPVMIVVSIPPGGPDGRGGERNLEYDTVSGKYSDFVETEVLPMAEKVANVKITKDPNGRAVMGTSSGAAASMTMAWLHPERYSRVLTFSGTFTNNQWPVVPEYPHGAWGLHETLIPNSPVKNLRIYMECGDRDNFNGPTRDWVEANENMAKVLAAKGYHYKFVFARNAGHTDKATISQLYPTALQWIWQGYPIEGK